MPKLDLSPEKTAFLQRQDEFDAARPHYILGPDERRLLALAMSHTNPFMSREKESDRNVVITAAEWAKGYREQDKAWPSLKGAAKRVGAGSLRLCPGEGFVGLATWVSMVWYDSGEKLVGLRLNDSVWLMLPGIYEELTNTALIADAKLNSIHTNRLLSLLQRQAEKTTSGERTITIGDFRFAMGCEEKFKGFQALKENVITPALAGIQDMYPGARVQFEKEQKTTELLVLKFRFTALPIAETIESPPIDQKAFQKAFLEAFPEFPRNGPGGPDQEVVGRTRERRRRRNVIIALDPSH